ncbi:tyrosine-type recombinase/integrase [Priestia megaterium]|uniref:tyrosine-type recombinase/integrase n=1 Tax=Priestia megaterium TaxID=1404 RepID=UPI00286C35AE|nr:tyrosine-type recombinase/integrase [Priestia megaterium]
MVTELKKYQTWQKRNKLKYGANYIEQEYMTTQANGKALSEFRINDIMKDITNKAKLHHISPHGLRHTHAIIGADIKFVSDRLGHTNIKMTADVYLHITKKYESENIAKLARYLSN